MGNMLLEKIQNNSEPNLGALVQQIRQQGPSNTLFNQMYNNNPSFRQFADSMKGKTPEQAFQENGLDFNQVRNLQW